eukprot:2512857-Rhodomonas_salina.1
MPGTKQAPLAPPLPSGTVRGGARCGTAVLQATTHAARFRCCGCRDPPSARTRASTPRAAPRVPDPATPRATGCALPVTGPEGERGEW